MALNLSTLTSPATSGNILEEVNTTADFLESVPVFRNLSRGSNKGGDAKQAVALNQPKALPLIKNPAGDLGGYLYIPELDGNYATGPSVTIGANETWEGELDMVIKEWGNYIMPMGGGFWTTGFGLLFSSSEGVRVFSKGVGPVDFQPSGITVGTSFNVKYGYDGSVFYADINGVRKFTTVAPSQSGTLTETLQLSQTNNLSSKGKYAIQKAKLTVNNAVVFDCDFNGSTSIRHGDTKFQAAVGGPVSLTKAGNDPVTVVKKDILRFDGVNDSLQGLFANNINSGYMFAAFSVLGDGGASSGRVLSTNSTGLSDASSSGAIFSLRQGTSNDLRVYQNGYLALHSSLFSQSHGDILHESLIKNGSQISRVNDADENTSNAATPLTSVEEFNIVSNWSGSNNAALDLEYLALFPATITDAQADSVRNYINNRNNVFSLVDGFGYYFYDAQKAPVGAISSGSSAWNGRIVGSDNGDADKLATQATANDSPVGNGYTVTFADNTDHLDIPSTTQAGWQIVGTSLGAFVYKVNNTAVTELNLLGNAGSSRAAGDLYGIILLPASASAADIDSARRLLIDRGASESVTGSSAESFWISRSDIVEFSSVDFTGVSNVRFGWNSCSAMTTFNVGSLPDATNVYNAFRSSGLTSFNTDLPSALRVDFAWKGCASLASFGPVDIKNCTNFTSAWEGCSALTSFPAGAKLGTDATNVNFNSAWRDSGLQSFPLIDTSRVTNMSLSWYNANLESFPLIDTSNVTVLNYSWYNNNLTSFPSINVSSCEMFYGAWLDNTSLTDFPPIFSNWNPTVISNQVFSRTWENTVALTAQSVGNILQSIDASNQHGTDDGTSTGNPLGDSGIDIDYNVATGSLSAATNTAVTSLKSKGWSIIVNNVTL